MTIQVSGADESSLYVEVTAVEGDEVVCIAKNSAILAGLLTLVHSRRQAGPDEDLVRVDLPVNLPLLSEVDINAMKCSPPPPSSPPPHHPFASLSGV